MQENNHILFKTLTQVSQDIANRKITSHELVEAVLDNISKRNGELNAIVTIDREAVLLKSKEADAMLREGMAKGPLHGVPITVKDNYEVAGVRCTASHKPYANNVSTDDATVVKRLRDAGAIIMGKTNLPELAMDFQTDSPIFGRTNNPWNPDRTPGGSSGGGAAAVASGMSFLDMGNDLLGSIRIPAHFCGIYSFLPSVNTVPRTGIIPKRDGGGTFGSLVRAGILARSVDDLMTAYEIIKGPDGKDLVTMPLEVSRPKKETQEKLKIAWLDDAEGIPVSPETKKALKCFVDRLEEGGHAVEKINSELLKFKLAGTVFARMLFSTIGAEMPRMICLAARCFGRNKFFDLDMREYLKAETQRLELIRGIEERFLKYDAIICPVTSTSAFPHQKPDKYNGPMPIYKKGIKVGDKIINYAAATTAFTVLFSVTGHPVTVIPIGRAEEGLPVGIQVVGKRWSDLNLLDMAKRLTVYAEPLGHP